MTKGHYLMFIFESKEGLHREYWPLLKPEEDIEEATERWVQSRLAHRKRNLAKAREDLMKTISSRRFCRPTSWHKDQAEKKGLPFPAPPIRKRKLVRR